METDRLFPLSMVPTMTPLRQRMIEDLQLRNYSSETVKAYVRYVALFARYFGRSPAVLTPEHARQYQLHLLKRKVSWSTFNQSVCALRFLYGTTLGRKTDIPRLPFGKKPKRIPVVLSREEVLKFLQCVLSRKQRMLLTTMYATGMRVGEAVRLGVADIDSRRMTILVARGKGNKQRLVPLSKTCSRSCVCSGRRIAIRGGCSPAGDRTSLCGSRRSRRPAGGREPEPA